MTLSEMASAVQETMLPMALMAYLQHLFSGAASETEILLTTSAVV
jgi:hypothetical protein